MIKYYTTLAEKPTCLRQDDVILLEVIDSVLFIAVPILGGAEQIALVLQWG